MPHVILPRPHPNIAVMQISGDLAFDDMTAVHPLGLHEGKPLAVLLDVTQMSTGVPEGFLTGAQQSFFVHENLIHLALYTESSLLRNIGLMVAKITRRRDKLSVHLTYEAALSHLKVVVEEFNQA